jgi:acyl-homoserine lactone synthase
MIRYYSRANLKTEPALLRTMHEDRKRVFVDTLRWQLANDGQQETDEFDDENAVYLASKDKSGSHLVSVRLLDTQRPHILGSLFSDLCDVEPPRGSGVKEITRYIASPRAKASERLVARNMMARGLIEYAHLTGVALYTAVCDLSFLNQILAAGWRCDPLGMPRPVGHSVIGAFCIHVEADTIEKMSRSWRYPRQALNVPRYLAAA